jgi:MOSC domain-containing protein YiiM
MKVISVNVGKAQEKEWQGKLVSTGIFKQAVETSQWVSLMGMKGDEQADMKHHGGINKAVYSYDMAYYTHWQQHLQRKTWEFGLFGENLTTQGLYDSKVCIGNIYQIGTTVLQAIQPRIPCFKLNIRFGLPDMVAQFFEHKRHGVYFKVLQEGYIGTGDEIELIKASDYEITITDVVECLTSKGVDRSKLAQILEIPFLPVALKEAFERF